MVNELKQEEFSKVKESSKALVDCYATWCGPCKMLSPVIDELAKEVDSYDFYKIDIDEAEEICEEYEIMSIPTLLLFENGELKDKLVGFKTKEELLEILK